MLHSIHFRIIIHLNYNIFMILSICIQLKVFLNYRVFVINNICIVNSLLIVFVCVFI